MAKTAEKARVTVEPSEVSLGAYVHISGAYDPPAGDSEIVIEAIYPSAAPIVYELGPPHDGGELSVRVGTLEPGEVLVRVFAVAYSGEGEQRVAGERTPLGTATFTVL